MLLAADWPTFGLIRTAGAGIAGGNGLVYTGTGTASDNGQFANSLAITVVPNSWYTFSAYIDATNVQSGFIAWRIRSTDGSVVFSEIQGINGTAKRVFTQWQCPASITQIILTATTDGSGIINAGKTAVWSNPMLEQGTPTAPKSIDAGGSFIASPYRIIPNPNALSLDQFHSLFNFRDPTPQELLLGDINNQLWAFNIVNYYAGIQRLNPYIDPTGAGDPRMAGPWSRSVLLNICFEMNGQVKQTGRGSGLSAVEGWGLDAPDASPGVSITSGGITKNVGRSYSVAWENSNKFNVGAPSPATQYVQYSNQQGAIALVQPGSVNTTIGSPVITGTQGSIFSKAWVGRSLWVGGIGNAGRIIAVQSASSLTLDKNQTVGVTNSLFTPFDPQATHLRLYATADGGANYLRMQRNIFNPNGVTTAAAGLVFIDVDATEPGQVGSTFTSELAQAQNVPPPIGAGVYEYQSRNFVYQVPGAMQTFFYSNVENTAVGDPPECFGPLNQITLPAGDGILNGFAGLPTGLLIWSNRHDMFKLTGTLTDNGGSTAIQQGAQIQRLPYALGSGSKFATMVTPLGAIWLTSDVEVFLFTDHYAPRNVGRPVQDILSSINPTQLSDARAHYVKTADRNWAVFAIATDTNTFNNKMLILDLDMLSSNGAPSFFVFDMATNQPSWYVFDIPCESIAASFDQWGYQHLLAGEVGIIRDATYATGFFAQAEDSVPNTVTLHPLGNDTAQSLKEHKWVRFVTNQDPGTLQVDGWSFGIDAIDDDFYTFVNPKSLVLYPGVNSPTLGNAAALLPSNPSGSWPGQVVQRPYEFSPALFVTQGIKFVRGRRIKYTINFPNKPGVDYELRSIQYELSAKGAS